MSVYTYVTKKTFITLYIKYNKLMLLDIKLAITQHQLSRI